MLDNHDPTSMERSNEGPTELTEVVKIFKDCSDRSFQQVATPTSIPEPDKEKDVPMALDKYSAACQTVDTDELMPEALKSKFVGAIEKTKLASLAKKYPSGAKVCLAFVPVQNGGVPSVELHMLEVDAKGLTHGYTLDPAYYFLVLPKEVQDKCSFRFPYYENYNFPTEAERAELKKRFEQAWDSLKQLVDKKKKAA